MKAILLLLIVFSATSCSLKEAIDNDFKTKSSITPFAKSKKLDDLYGDKIKIKIPLTETSVGYYEVEDILDNNEKNSKSKSFMKRFFDKIKLGLYRLAIKFGVSNNIRYSTYYDFESIDPDFLKSAKITKVFFTTEECRPEEEFCNGSKKITSNFNFVDRFFVNVSNYTKEETEGALEFIPNEDFRERARRSFEQNTVDIVDESQIFTTNDNSQDWSEKTPSSAEPNEINLVKFSNAAPELDLIEKDLPEHGDEFAINIGKNNDLKQVQKYFEGAIFNKVIKRAKIKKKENQIEIKLKKGVTIREAFALIKAEQSKNLTSKMVIFRLNSRLIETKKYFEQDKFKEIIHDSTMIGRSLFVELVDNNKKNELQRILDKDESFISRELDFYKIEKCDNSNCLDLEVKEYNLIPMLVKNPKLKIDSYISVKSLGKEDFKYNGFIEIEVDISIPL